ncbi:MAG: nucleotide exchange factor GrpE [Bacteroidota bacterium]
MIEEGTDSQKNEEYGSEKENEKKQEPISDMNEEKNNDEVKSNDPGIFEAELTDATTAEAEPVASLEVQLTEANDRYLRLFAEFDNYKKRMERDRKDSIRMANQDLLLAILPVVDDFDRAIKSITEQKSPLADGVQLIYQKIYSILEARGVKAIDAVGKPFDTNFHEAIAQIPAPSDSQKNMVIEEVTKGYYLHDRVLRFSKVVVGI